MKMIKVDMPQGAMPVLKHGWLMLAALTPENHKTFFVGDIAAMCDDNGVPMMVHGGCSFPVFELSHTTAISIESWDKPEHEVKKMAAEGVRVQLEEKAKELSELGGQVWCLYCQDMAWFEVTTMGTQPNWLAYVQVCMFAQGTGLIVTDEKRGLGR